MGFKSGEVENKKSMIKGEGKHSHGAESVHNIERVGSKHPENHSFRMPKNVTDHSIVRTPGG